MPPPRLPLPQGRYSPRSSVWGEPEEGAGVWGRSPGYDFPWASSSWGGGCRHIGSRDRGGGTCPPPRLPLPPRRYLPRSSVWGYAPDTAFPGYRHDCPRLGRGGGCRHVESRDRGGGTCPPPRLPLPQGRYLPRSSVWGEPEEKTGVWVGDAGIFRLPLPPRRYPPRSSECVSPGRSGGSGILLLHEKVLSRGAAQERGTGRIRRAGARPRSGSVRG